MVKAILEVNGWHVSETELPNGRRVFQVRRGSAQEISSLLSRPRVIAFALGVIVTVAMGGAVWIVATRVRRRRKRRSASETAALPPPGGPAPPPPRGSR